MLKHILLLRKYKIYTKYILTEYNEFRHTEELKIVNLYKAKSFDEYDHIIANKIPLSVCFKTMEEYLTYMKELIYVISEEKTLNRSLHRHIPSIDVYMEDWVYTNDNFGMSLSWVHFNYQQTIRSLITRLKNSNYNDHMYAYYSRIAKPAFQQSRYWNRYLYDYRDLKWTKKKLDRRPK